MRSMDDDQLNGNGGRIKNASEGVAVQIARTAAAVGVLDIYLILCDYECLAKY